MANEVLDQLTLLELAKRTNNGDLVTIVEVLHQTNEILQDAVWIESNQATSHVTTRRTHLPTGSWRRINKGVTGSASATKQITEGMGMLEDYSTVDKALVDIAPNPREFRSQEDVAFIEGLGQTLAYTIIYGNVADDPASFTGLAARYGDDPDDAFQGVNVWNGNGTGDDTTSLWIVEWGPTKVHMIYPKGSSSVGIQARDLGEQTVDDGAGGIFQAFRTHFQMRGGIVVRDDRCVQRIPNIETAGSDNTLNDDLIITALNQMPQAGGGPGTRIYVNRTLKTQFDILAKDKTNVAYTSAEIFGKPVTMFRGVPVKLVEQILNTETAITFS